MAKRPRRFRNGDDRAAQRPKKLSASLSPSVPASTSTASTSLSAALSPSASASLSASASPSRAEAPQGHSPLPPREWAEQQVRDVQASASASPSEAAPADLVDELEDVRARHPDVPLTAFEEIGKINRRLGRLRYQQRLKKDTVRRQQARANARRPRNTLAAQKLVAHYERMRMQHPTWTQRTIAQNLLPSSQRTDHRAIESMRGRIRRALTKVGR